MTKLLADVGGTNARLAMSCNGVIDYGSVTRFRGDDYRSFDAVVQEYLAGHNSPAISSVCVAVAGPVRGGIAELTNRDWDFSEARLAQLTGAGQVRLINDLTALGYATQVLRGDGLKQLRSAPKDRNRNGQALVVGLGTGFNICAVKTLPGGIVSATEAEEGHTNLPANIYRRLAGLLGADKAEAFFSTEETFAGRGLSRFHALRTGTRPVRSELIAEAAAGGEADAVETYNLFAGLTGLLCRELALRFIPSEGLYLAGSVGRSIADRAALFEEAFLSESFMRHIPDNTPVFLIQDDFAALHGCLRALL